MQEGGDGAERIRGHHWGPKSRSSTECKICGQDFWGEHLANHGRRLVAEAGVAEDACREHETKLPHVETRVFLRVEIILLKARDGPPDDEKIRRLGPIVETGGREAAATGTRHVPGSARDDQWDAIR